VINTPTDHVAMLVRNASTYLSICPSIHLSVCLSVYPSIRLSIYLSIYLYSCCSHLEHRTFMKRFVSLQFLNLRQSVGPLGRGISPSQGRYLHRTTQTKNKRRKTSMPWVRFEPTIPVFERAKSFHALDPAATVIGKKCIRRYNFWWETDWEMLIWKTEKRWILIKEADSLAVTWNWHTIMSIVWNLVLTAFNFGF
jgi:hypothetical protein